MAINYEHDSCLFRGLFQIPKTRVFDSNSNKLKLPLWQLLKFRFTAWLASLIFKCDFIFFLIIGNVSIFRIYMFVFFFVCSQTERTATWATDWFHLFLHFAASCRLLVPWPHSCQPSPKSLQWRQLDTSSRPLNPNIPPTATWSGSVKSSPDPTLPYLSHLHRSLHWPPHTPIHHDTHLHGCICKYHKRGHTVSRMQQTGAFHCAPWASCLAQLNQCKRVLICTGALFGLLPRQHFAAATLSPYASDWYSYKVHSLAAKSIYFNYWYMFYVLIAKC